MWLLGPLTNLLWGDGPTLVNHDKEASTSKTQNVNEVSTSRAQHGTNMENDEWDWRS